MKGTKSKKASGSASSFDMISLADADDSPSSGSKDSGGEADEDLQRSAPRRAPSAQAMSTDPAASEIVPVDQEEPTRHLHPPPPSASSSRRQDAPSSFFSPFNGLIFGPSPATPSSAHADPDPIRKELEEATAAAAAAASKAKDKLMHGAAEAKAGFTSFMHNIWAGLEGPAGGDPGAGSSASDRPEVDLRETLSLAEGEAVLESFRCKVIQTYSADNGFTAPKRLAFPGTLHVSTGHVCFVVDRSGKEPATGGSSIGPIKVPKADVKAVVRHPTEVGQPGALELSLAGPAAGKSLVFGQFTLRDLELDSAAALLEHIMLREDVA